MTSSVPLVSDWPASSAASVIAVKQAFKSRVRHWAQILEVPITGLAVRPMRHKWASCSSKGDLNFSSDLLPLDQDLWDVVIVHELLHLRIPNHGRLWQMLMTLHLGDWRSCEARLNQQPRRLTADRPGGRLAAPRSPLPR